MAIYGTETTDTIHDIDNKGSGYGGVYALGGNDLVVVNGFEDDRELLDGGQGLDTVSFINWYGVGIDIGPVHSNKGYEGDGYSADTRDILRSFENVIASNGDDRIRGGAGGNELFGMKGDDLLEGRGGPDRLDGGAGFDTATYEYALSQVTIDLGTGQGRFGQANGDRLFSIEGLVGTKHNDELYGNAGKNVLDGRNGEDLLHGRDGNDKLSGGNASDSLLGGNGNDELVGGSSSDLLLGGRGADVLTGGTGADTFRFLETTDSFLHFLVGGKDRITDFNHSTGDRIDLSAIDARSDQGGNQTFSFIGDDAFTALGQVRAYASGENVVVEANTSSAAGEEMVFVMQDIVTLGVADFIL